MRTSQLYKYVSGQATPEERIEILRWIESNDENKQAYLKLRKLYNASAWVELQEPKQVTPPISSKNTWKSTFFKVAASVAFIVLAGLLTLTISVDEAIEYHLVQVPAGQSINITLSDGSVVYLNAQSELKFPSNFKENRQVYLNGEGFFYVKSDAENPFVVISEQGSVKATGTEFNVSAYHNYPYSTTLKDGKVDVLIAQSNKTYTLKPDEQLRLDENNEAIVQTITSNSYMDWVRGIIVADDITLLEFIERLENYYDISFIKDTDSNVLNEKVTAKFYIKDGVKQILDVLQVRYKFNYTINERNQLTLF